MDQKPRQERDQQDEGQRDQDRPNQNANKEPAEGSRETVRANQDRDEGGGQPRPRDAGERNEYPRQEGDRGSGITNRPLDRELKEQAEVPTRGRTNDEDRHA
jgi:hypothetical protein